MPSTLVPQRLSGSQGFWCRHGEASCNWLALGLLLAAWNATDGDGAERQLRRPQSLRGYTCVSVRAVERACSSLR
jgi:hypothetical protein